MKDQVKHALLLNRLLVVSFATVFLFFFRFARLFAKLSWPTNSKVTFAVFESSYHLLLPV